MEARTKELYELYKENYYMVDKYNHSGIYYIMIEDKIVYIGKSRDMLYRIAQHQAAIEMDETKNKYRVMADALKSDMAITFGVFYITNQTTQDAIDVDIGYQEAYYINEYLPPLNYQIPKMNNYRSFTVNKTAKTKTLEEIMG